MQPKTSALLWDMFDHGEYILARCASLTLPEYETNRDVRLAIERAFHNLGEAARRIASSDPDVAGRITALSAIIAFRNVLAHNYDDIDNSRVWAVIETHLPLLMAEIRILIPEIPGE